MKYLITIPILSLFIFFLGSSVKAESCDVTATGCTTCVDKAVTTCPNGCGVCTGRAYHANHTSAASIIAQSKIKDTLGKKKGKFLTLIKDIREFVSSIQC